MPHDDEFTKLLEFGMQFPDLDSQNADGRLPPHSVANPTSIAPSTSNEFIRMDTDVPYDRMMDTFSMDAFNSPNGMSHSQVGPSYPNGNVPAFYNQDPPPHHQHQRLPQGQSHQPSHQQSSSHQYGRTVIPPTPNSIELHGSAAHYPQRVDENHEFYDRYTRMNDEQVGGWHRLTTSSPRHG